MAFVSTSVKLIVENRRRYDLRGPVLTLGVPEFYITGSQLDRWLIADGSQPPAASAISARTISANPLGKRLGWLSPASFFDALDIRPWVSIDIPGCEHPPDLVHDLNQPFPTEFENAFELILDPGTTEHVFDIKTALTNVVQALRKGGTIIHQVPIYMYNGGYYSLNPILLFDFYRDNGFTDLQAYVIMWDRYRAYCDTHVYYQYDDRWLGARHALTDSDQCRFSPLLLFAARKAEVRTGVVNPVQSYQPILRPDPSRSLASRLVKHAFRLGYQVFPFSPVFYAEAWLHRTVGRIRLARHRRRG
jgi:hypothetical protein